MIRKEGETTANVIRAQARKEVRRAECRATLQEEATRLGITVHELQQRNWDKVQEIRKRESENPSLPSFVARQRTRPYDWRDW